MVSRLMQIVNFGVILSLYFWQIPKNQVGVYNMMNVLWEANALVFVGMLNCAATFPIERDVFYRERTDGRYSSLAFFLSYSALELTFGFICSMAFGVVVTFTVGLTHSIQAICLLSTAVFFVVSFGESVGMMYCAVFRQVGFALSLISVNLGLMHITAGFLTVSLKAWVDAILNINPLRFSSRVMVDAELADQTFSCQEPVFSSCVSNGKEVKDFYGFNYSLTKSMLILIGLCAGYRILAFLALSYFPKLQGDLHAEWKPSEITIDDKPQASHQHHAITTTT